MNKGDIDGLIATYRREGFEEEDDDDDVDEEFDNVVKGRKPFVDWTSFNLGVALVITGNALTIGLETDARYNSSNDDNPVWYAMEIIFCLLFFFELALRLFYHGFAYFVIPLPQPDAKSDDQTAQVVVWTWRLYWLSFPNRVRLWNIMDLIIVLTSIIDTFILLPMGEGGNARFVSMIRFVRLLRLIRLVRLFKIFKELWLVANGLVNAMKTLLWVCVMILIVLYIAGIFATLWVGHNDELYDPYFKQSGWDHEIYFATVARSIFTLFQVVTLDQWAENIARHVIKIQPGMLIFFLLLICIVTLGLLNIIVGVVVENALGTAARDQHKLKKARDRDRAVVFGQLREIFQDADSDGSGTLTFEEVQTAINKPEIYNKLRMIDFPVEDPQHIFSLLDYDESGELTIEEFITGCLRMKGSAKSKDLLVAQVALDCMKKYYFQFERELETLQAKIARLDATARAITDHGERVFLDMRQYRQRHPSERGANIPRMDSMIMKEAPWEAANAEQDDESALAPYRTYAASSPTSPAIADAERYTVAHRHGAGSDPRIHAHGHHAIEDSSHSPPPLRDQHRPAPAAILDNPGAHHHHVDGQAFQLAVAMAVPGALR